MNKMTRHCQPGLFVDGVCKRRLPSPVQQHSVVPMWRNSTDCSCYALGRNAIFLVGRLYAHSAFGQRNNVLQNTRTVSGPEHAPQSIPE